MNDPSRDRGILNERQRRWLSGELEIEHPSQKRRNIRSAIRSQLENSIIDFSMLLALPQDDLDLVYETYQNYRDRQGETGRLQGLAGDLITGKKIGDGIVDMFAFMYLFLDEEELFERKIEAGVKKAVQSERPDAFASPSVTIQLNVDQDLAKVRERFLSGEPVEDFRLWRLLQADEELNYEVTFGDLDLVSEGNKVKLSEPATDG